MIVNGFRCRIGDWESVRTLSSAHMDSLAGELSTLRVAARTAIDTTPLLGVGRTRYIDPLSRCIAHLAADDTLPKRRTWTNRVLVLSVARSASEHYFSISRALNKASGAISPLAFSNRSLNAIPAQVSQLLGYHGGAYTIYADSDATANVLRVVARHLLSAPERTVFLCGGQFPSADEAAKRIYPEQRSQADCAFACYVSSADIFDADARRIALTEDPPEVQGRIDILSKPGSLVIRDEHGRDSIKLNLGTLTAFLVGMILSLRVTNSLIALDPQGSNPVTISRVPASSLI